MRSTTVYPWKRLFAWTGVVGVLLAVFSLYLRPDFMVDMAQQLWACF